MDLESRLDSLVRNLATRRRIPHAVLAVENGDGSFQWTGAAGRAQPDGTPMRPETPYFIASIDKILTAALILKLSESDGVLLDAPFVDYLPGQLTQGLHRVGGEDRTGEITVRDLLGHTSGLADYIEDRPTGGRTLVDRLVEEGDFAWSLDEALETVRGRMKPHFPPGRGLRYCDTNYLLLIAIIEAVTGQPLHRAYDEALFRPLDLRHTWLPGHSEPRETMPKPAVLWFRDQPVLMPSAHRSLWSVFSTAQDTVRILRGLIRGEVFDNPATFGIMRQRWRRFGFPLDMAALRAPSWPIEYGLGLMRFRIPRLFTPIRAIPSVFGHTGSTGTWLFYCEELDLFVAGGVSQATAGPVPFRFVPQVLEAVSVKRSLQTR
ncbi:MAG: beta-lactamase family protein [Bryobacterales bacterium]|nr:beta-lactamase family protein [Bryobacterales bacterium]